MARIMMKKAHNESISEAFEGFMLSAQSRGLTNKTLASYRTHFHSISKRLDIEKPISQLTKKDLEEMIAKMREENLTDTSINSYTRTLKVFFSWCNEERITNLNIKLYKASETVKETYTDEELLKLIEKPSRDCNFCEFRNWAIVNFLINSGCRASTLRNIQIRDVDLKSSRIMGRHSKNRKTQVIPLCQTMVAILKDYMSVRGGQSEDYLFCNEFGNMLSESALRQAISKYNRSRGVEKTSLHSFRHTFARKYLIDCGGDAFTLQKLMWHSTLKMTKHYCNIFDSDIVDNYENLSPLAQLQKETHKKTIKR